MAQEKQTKKVKEEVVRNGVNRGKQFEGDVREDWKRTVPDSFIIRLPDQISGYINASANPCDLIAFKSPYLFLIECKSIHGNTLPFSNIHQYSKLLKYKGITNLFPGILLWWIDLNTICWVPIEELEKMKKDGKKSVHIKMLDESEYKLFKIPAIKKTVRMQADYSTLVDSRKEV